MKRRWTILLWFLALMSCSEIFAQSGANSQHIDSNSFNRIIGQELREVLHYGMFKNFLCTSNGIAEILETKTNIGVGLNDSVLAITQSRYISGWIVNKREILISRSDSKDDTNATVHTYSYYPYQIVEIIRTTAGYDSVVYSFSDSLLRIKREYVGNHLISQSHYEYDSHNRLVTIVPSMSVTKRGKIYFTYNLVLPDSLLELTIYSDSGERQLLLNKNFSIKKTVSAEYVVDYKYRFSNGNLKTVTRIGKRKSSQPSIAPLNSVEVEEYVYQKRLIKNVITYVFYEDTTTNIRHARQKKVTSYNSRGLPYTIEEWVRREGKLICIQTTLINYK